MTRIYLIRHAEAEGNYYRRVQGWYDGGITSRGKLQIEALAERFRDTEINALYSSDLTRTRETAGAILKYHKDLALIPDERLREVNMGIWEDVMWGNASFDTPEQMALFANDPERWDIPGGEKFSVLQSRLVGAIEDIARRHDGQTIAIVSHGAAIRSVICHAKGVCSENIAEIPHGDNTCVALFEYENGRFTNLFFNDNSHLVEELSTLASQAWWRDEVKTRGIDEMNLRIVPMNIDEDAQLYKDCYADSWKNAHGNLKGFDAKTYLRGARAVAGNDPSCLMKAYSGGTKFTGLIELDPQRAAEHNAGWISFFYIIPENRGRLFGPQLLGHAVSYFRRAGRRAIRLHVSESNQGAVHFYEREGFRVIGSEKGAIAKLLLMEMEI